jgi:hypothetical protein
MSVFSRPYRHAAVVLLGASAWGALTLPACSGDTFTPAEESGGTGGAPSDGGAAGTSSLGGAPGTGGEPTAGSGGTSGCTVASDCATPAAPCLVATCVEGVCGTAPGPDKDLPDPKPLDCRKLRCVSGKETSQRNEFDIPDTDAACYVGSCAGDGKPTIVKVADNTPCGTVEAPRFCTSGACVACDKDHACAKSTVPCQQTVCKAGECAQEIDPGAPLADPNASDCTVPACAPDGTPTTENRKSASPCTKTDGNQGACDAQGKCK